LQSAEYRPPGIEGGGGRIEVSLSSDAAAYAELFGEVTIRNQEDTVVATHPISRNNSLLILPGGQRTVVIALGQKPPPGQYEVVLNVRVEDGGPVEEQSVELVIPPEPEQPPGVAEEQGAAQT